MQDSSDKNMVKSYISDLQAIVQQSGCLEKSTRDTVASSRKEPSFQNFLLPKK